MVVDESQSVLFLVEDDSSVRDALTQLAELRGIAVSPCGSAESFLRTLTDDACGCILLDLDLPGMSGSQLLHELSERPTHPPVVVISGQADVPDVIHAFRFGIMDFLVKPIEPRAVMEAVERAIAFSDTATAEANERSRLKSLVGGLTRRESEVFEHISFGRLNKEIAAVLGISQKTVEFHRARVMRKLGASSMAELMRVAFATGVRSLIDAEPVSPNA